MILFNDIDLIFIVSIFIFIGNRIFSKYKLYNETIMEKIDGI